MDSAAALRNFEIERNGGNITKILTKYNESICKHTLQNKHKQREHMGGAVHSFTDGIVKFFGK